MEKENQITRLGSRRRIQGDGRRRETETGECGLLAVERV